MSVDESSTNMNPAFIEIQNYWLNGQVESSHERITRPAHNPRRLPCSGRLQVDHQQVRGVNMIKMTITTIMITTKTSTSQVGKMARPILKASLSSEYLAMERRSTWIWKTTGENEENPNSQKKAWFFSFYLFSTSPYSKHTIYHCPALMSLAVVEEQLVQVSRLLSKERQ